MLFEELSETFPAEVVEPYGEVLIVPVKAFKPEWRSMLEAEGVQIYTNAYRGQVCFFLRKKASNQAPQEQPQPNVGNSCLKLMLFANIFSASKCRGCCGSACRAGLRLQRDSAEAWLNLWAADGRVFKPKPEGRSPKARMGSNAETFKEAFQ
jgi:hypothetical protein